MRKIISIIALTVLSGIALGQTKVKVRQLYYQITGENTASVVPELSDYPSYNNEGNKPTGDIIIPPTVDIEGRTYTVTAIGDDAFYKCSGLTSVNIPYSVTSIGGGAFGDCSGLTSIVIPNSVTSIEGEAFDGCSGLTSINIPNSITNIGKFLFSSCSGLKEVTVNWTTPLSVSDIFLGTPINNATLYVPAGTAELYRQTNVWKDFGTITDIRKVGQLYYQITGENTTSVASGADKPTGSVTIPQTVEIEGRTYTVTTIGNDAFYNCSGLTSIDIPNSVTSIGNNAFWYCSSLTSINVDETNTAYTSQDGVLYSKDKTTLHTCPAGKAGEFIIPSHVTNIGKGAFSACSKLTSVNIPNTITSIGGSTFYGCSGLTSVNIPNSVTSIGYQAFWGCSGLTSIDIPNSVTSIGGWVFSGCSSLKDVTVNWRTPISIQANVFEGVNLEYATLYVPEGRVERYQRADVWKEFDSIVEATSSILSAVGDKDAITEIYNLRGERLSATNIDALPRGIYIVKKGGKAIKVVKP